MTSTDFNQKCSSNSTISPRFCKSEHVSKNSLKKHRLLKHYIRIIRTLKYIWYIIIHILNIYKYKYNKTTPLRVGLSTLLGLSQTRGPAHPPNPTPTDHHPTLGSSNQPPSYASWIDPMSMPMLLGSVYRGPRAHLRPHGASRLPYVGCPNKKGQQVVPYSPELQEEFHL